MFNHIRKVPYAQPDGKGGLNYFAGGFQSQFGLETQIVAAIYGVLSFATISLALKVPRIRDAKQQQVAVLVWGGVVLGVYSFLLSVFRIKNGGCEYFLFLSFVMMSGFADVLGRSVLVAAVLDGRLRETVTGTGSGWLKENKKKWCSIFSMYNNAKEDRLNIHLLPSELSFESSKSWYTECWTAVPLHPGYKFYGYMMVTSCISTYVASLNAAPASGMILTQSEISRTITPLTRKVNVSALLGLSTSIAQLRPLA